MENSKKDQDKTGKKEELSKKTKLDVKEADDPKGSELSGIPGTGEDKNLGTPASAAGAAGTKGTGTSSKKRLE